MSFSYPAMRAVLRKDLRLFWHFALLTSVMVAVFKFPPLVDLLGGVAGLMRLVLQFAAVLLILVVIYEDAVVSLRRDWLTRPIPGPTLLVAKALFIVVALLVPSVLGGIAYELYRGHSVGEALLVGFATGLSGDVIIGLLLVMACAAVTASIRQAIMVVAAVVLCMALMQLAMYFLADPAVSPLRISSAWVVAAVMQITLLVAAVLVLWVQYRHRHTKAARAIAGGAVVFIFGSLLLLSMPRVLAVQQALSRDPGAHEMVQVRLTADCLPVRRLGPDGKTLAGGEALRADLFPEETVEKAGAGALVYSTRLVQEPLPAGYRLLVDFTDLQYQAGGQPLGHPGRDQMLGQRAFTDEGLRAFDDFWLLSDADHRRLAATPGIETRIDYAMTLLRSRGTASFVADGRRSYFPRVGYCSATVDTVRQRVRVDCFKGGDRPAFLTAAVEGQPANKEYSTPIAEYRPAALDFWGGYRFTTSLQAPGGPPPRVTVTTYEPVVHFSRQLVSPGVLGGSAPACPAP